MKKILSLFTLLFAFFGMAWAQDTTKPFKVSDAPNGTSWAENTTWYYIKPANVDSYHPTAWLSPDNDYIHTDGALKLTNAAIPTDDTGLWCIVGNDNDGYKFYNKSKGTSFILGMEGSENNAFAKMYETANTGSATTAFFYGESTSMPGNACFKLDKEGNNWWNNRDTGHTGGAHLALWNNANSGPNDKGSAFKFIEVKLLGNIKLSNEPTTSGWAENTTWYYIKPANVDDYHPKSWLSAAQSYIHTDGALKLTNAAKPTDDMGLWCIVGNDTDGYKFYNKGKGTSYILGMEGSENNAFAKMYETANTGSATTAFFYGESTTMPGNACFKLDKEGNNWWNNRDSGHTGGAHLALWNNANSGPNDNGSAFKFVETGCMEDCKMNLQMAIENSKLYIEHIGTNVNQYTQSVGDQPLRTIVSEAESLMQAEGTTKGELQAAKNELNTVINGLVINQPENGKFYRIRCIDGMKYILTSMLDNCLETKNEQNNAALFYCQDVATSNKTLLAFNNGQYFGNAKTEGKNTFAYIAVGNDNNKDFAFSEGGQKGCYKIQQGNRYIYGARDKMDSGTNPNSNGYYWWLEEVTTLPVTVSAAGWATLYAPVALTIPATEGLTVYTAAVEGNTLKLKALNGTIPANTPVLIEANAATYNFTIDYNAAAEAQTTGLKGTLETINKPADKTIYTLQKPAAANNEIGFYKYGGETLQGFRAYGENLLGTTSTAEGLIFDKGDVTAIENVEINDGKQTVIYDLNGRRVEKMLKGIYIVNGKKVIK